MLSSILSLSAEDAAKLDDYAIQNSSSLTPLLKSHHEWTQQNFPDADRASSLLQAQWMQRRASEKQPKRVLDIGCYTGLSALAWYEGTREIGAKIITIEYDAQLAETARKTFKKHGCDDRIEVMEGRAEDIIESMIKPFDIIFVDLEFSAYQPILEQLLRKDLIAQEGIVLVDNVFARGFAIGTANTANIDKEKLGHWKDAGEIVRKFNEYIVTDPRVRVTMLPFFDGISEISLV